MRFLSYALLLTFITFINSLQSGPQPVPLYDGDIILRRGKPVGMVQDETIFEMDPLQYESRLPRKMVVQPRNGDVVMHSYRVPIAKYENGWRPVHHQLHFLHTPGFSRVAELSKKRETKYKNN